MTHDFYFIFSQKSFFHIWKLNIFKPIFFIFFSFMETEYFKKIFLFLFFSEKSFFHIWKLNIFKYFLSIFFGTDYSYP